MNLRQAIKVIRGVNGVKRPLYKAEYDRPLWRFNTACKALDVLKKHGMTPDDGIDGKRKCLRYRKAQYEAKKSCPNVC